MSELKYKRILLKVSGEALGEKTAQGDGFGLDFSKIAEVAAAITGILLICSAEQPKEISAKKNAAGITPSGCRPPNRATTMPEKP